MYHRTNGKLGNTGVRCRLLGICEEESAIERRHGFKLLRELDRKILYSHDVYFSENEVMEPSDDLVENYDKFYASLEKQALEELADKEIDQINARGSGLK
jgi:hypothetical protein